MKFSGKASNTYKSCFIVKKSWYDFSRMNQRVLEYDPCNLAKSCLLDSVHLLPKSMSRDLIDGA